MRNIRTSRLSFRLYCILLCLLFGHILIAQTEVSEGIMKVWIDTEWQDSSTIHLQAKVLNQTNQDELYYYAVRISHIGSSTEKPVEKMKGLVYCAIDDTTTAYQITKTFKPGEDIQIFFYLLENEYVVGFHVWTLDEALAQKNNTKPQKPSPLLRLAKDEFSIGGLVINETRTRFGKEFFQKFLENWKAPDGAEGFWINVREKPTNGRFTVISIMLNNREIFQRHLIPSPDFINNLASQLAIEIANLLAEGNYDGGISNEDLFGKGVE